MKKLLILGASVLAGCGLFDGEDPFDIEFEEQVPVAFRIDADRFCPTTIDCTAAEGPAPDRVELPPVELDIDIDILEATGSTQLREVSSRLKSIEVDRVEYKYLNNTLNIKTPNIKLYVAPENASSRGSGAELASVPQAEAGATPSGTETVPDDQKDAASDILKTLQISVIPYMEAEAIERGQPSPPKGGADIEMILHLKVVANPTELL